MPGLGVLPYQIMVGNAKLSAPLLARVSANACKLNILENFKKKYILIFFLILIFF
jgi:hypothetical protein